MGRKAKRNLHTGRWPSFFRRLRVAWLVLLNRIPIAETGELPIGVGELQSASPLRLSAQWWCAEEKLDAAKSACVAELGRMAAENTSFQLEKDLSDGSYLVRGELYIYKPEENVSC